MADALRCPKCGYDVTSQFVESIDSVICPECGEAVSKLDGHPRYRVISWTDVATGCLPTIVVVPVAYFVNFGSFARLEVVYALLFGSCAGFFASIAGAVVTGARNVGARQSGVDPRLLEPPFADGIFAFVVLAGINILIVLLAYLIFSFTSK